MKLATLACVSISALGVRQCLASCGTLTASCGPINLTIHNADSSQLPVVSNAIWGLTDCQVNPTTDSASCPTPRGYIQQTSTGYTYLLIADDAGSSNGLTSGQRIPYVGTIGTSNTLNGTLTLTLKGALRPVFITGGTTTIDHVAELLVANGGTGYSFGSTQTLACTSCGSSDGHIDAFGHPAIMAGLGGGVSAIVNHGTGGSQGSCTLVPTSQTALGGNLTQFRGTVSSSASGGTFTLSSVIGGSIVNDNIANYQSSGAYLDTLAGCNFASNPPTANVFYGVADEQLVSGSGIFVFSSTSTISCFSTAAASTSDAGSGLELYCAGTASHIVNPYTGSVAFGADNTALLQKAVGTVTGAVVGTMNYAAARGQPECLYLPAGNYLTRPLNTDAGAGTSYIAQGYGCWLGDERFHSNVFVVPNYPGDVFAWANSNANGSAPNLGSTQTFDNFSSISTGTANQGGSSFRNISVIGDRFSTAAQNALAFYGETQFANLDNIGVFYMNGRALYAGGTNTTGAGNFSDSIIQNMRFEFDGNGSLAAPTMEITANGTSAGSHNVNLWNVRIYQSRGTALWIHNTGSLISSNTQNVSIANLKIEGSDVSPQTLGGELLELGDPSSTANISYVLGRNIVLTNPVIGYNALRIAGSSPTDTANIDIEGEIAGQSPDDGNGVKIDACNQCSIKLADDSTEGYDLVLGTIGPGGTCSGATFGPLGIVFDDNVGTASPSSVVVSCLGTSAGAVISPSYLPFQ